MQKEREKVPIPVRRGEEVRKRAKALPLDSPPPYGRSRIEPPRRWRV